MRLCVLDFSSSLVQLSHKIKYIVYNILLGVPWTLEVISSAISYKNPSKSAKWAEFLMDLATSLAVSF